MRAVLIGDRLFPEIPDRNGGPERLLPPLVDRPFLQHVVESIVEAGADEIDVMLAGASKQVPEALGNGNRWGVVLRYHHIPSRTSPYDAVADIESPGGNDAVLLAHADVLPEMNKDSVSGSTAPLFFCWADGAVRWTGWGMLRIGDLQGFRSAFNAQDAFDRHCEGSGIKPRFSNPAIEEVPRPLLVGSYPDLIEAHLRVLQNQHSGLLLTGRTIAPGVRISRNVTIHRTAKLAGPVFIGENTRISEHCHIGPGASIGRDCLIRNRTMVENSVICPGSYVGEGLELRQVYIDRGRLVNARLLAEIDGVDDLLLGSVYKPKGTRAQKAVSWIR